MKVSRRRMRPLRSKHNDRAWGREMKLEGCMKISLTKHNMDKRTRKTEQ